MSWDNLNRDSVANVSNVKESNTVFSHHHRIDFGWFYVIISLPTVETFFAPVIVKTTYSTERVEEGTLISFAGFKIRPCRTISSSWSYDDTEGRSTALNVKNMRTSANTFNTTLDLGRFSVGPILLENLPDNAKSVNMVVFHSCHAAWPTMSQLTFDIIKN